MELVHFSVRRMLLLAHHTLREAARQRMWHALLVLAFGLVLGAQFFRELNFGTPELRFLADFGLGAMALFGTVFTVVATTQLFFTELENRTVQTLLAKPVGRGEFIVGKLLGVAAMIGVFCALLTALLAVVVWTRETALMRELPEAFPAGRVTSYAHLAVAGFFQWLKLAVLSALTLLVASYARTQLFTVVMGFLLFGICHLQYLARDGGTIGELLGLVFPNFQLFNHADALGTGATLPWAHVARISLYAFGYMAAAGGLAVFSFGRREL